ncbi:AAA family ATPase [Prevotella stercorea]|nr:AAA family ATPase [Leyella stercorea]
MQQRYDIQRNHIVTQLLNLVKEIRVGDVLLLTFDNIIYAYGIVVRCPFQTRQISNLQNIVSLRQYDYNDGIVCFEDAPAFYEDLRDGEENWGQRVSVDQWHCYDNDSTVYNSGCQSALLAGNTQQSIFEVDAKFAQDKIKELEKQYYKKYMFINNTAKLLKSKHNIILQGAPGTGKTYNTAAIALSVLGIDGVDLDNHDEVMKKYEELQDDRIFFTTFHQSLDYEDFVEGLKPRVQSNENGESLGVTYEPEDGIFKRACNAVVTDDSKDIIECIDDYLQKIKGFENRREIPTVTGKSSLYVWWNEGNKTVSSRSTNSTSQREESYSPSPLNIEKIKAQTLGKGCENNWQQYAQAFIEAVKNEYHAKTDKSVVLIIDEINRGNVSKIFGELITLLEADKRDKGNHPIKVTLPYSKTLFGVPSNLYIIGTMNTTDRSTGTLDYAIRRRFAFVTLKSDPNVIVKHYEKLGNDDLKAIAIDLFNNIKAFITNPKHLCGDLCIDDLMVGHSYFMVSSKEELQCKVEFEIIPLIAEYINDGILTVNDQEKEKAFDAWASLQPVQIVDDEDEDNIDEEDE